MTLYGKLSSEKLAEDNETCRKIVKEINDFGITDNQCLLLIYLLSLQVENFEHAREIAETVRTLRSDLFLVDSEEDGTSSR